MSPDREAEAVLAALLREPLPPGPCHVVAPSMRQAASWAGMRKLSRRQWHYVQGIGGLLGCTGTIVVVNGGNGWLTQGDLDFFRARGVRVLRERT